MAVDKIMPYRVHRLSTAPETHNLCLRCTCSVGPLLVCWSLSTIGMFMFFCCGYRTHNKLCAKEMFEGHLHVHQNRVRREKLNALSFSELYTVARAAGSIGEEDLADAVDALPQRRASWSG